VHGDNRGRFVETFRQEWLPKGPRSMVQGNRADRKRGALVGLYHRFQSDFWYVPYERAMVVLHDLRASSPTDGNTLVLRLISPRKNVGRDTEVPRPIAEAPLRGPHHQRPALHM
jgi:dTDP-4-dehydrorhamnose 3,5-epimerase-like enzyme